MAALASSHLVKNCIDFTIDLLLHCNNFTFYIFLFQMLQNKDHSLSVGIYSFRFLFRYILLVFLVCCQLCEHQSNASVVFGLFYPLIENFQIDGNINVVLELIVIYKCHVLKSKMPT